MSSPRIPEFDTLWNTSDAYRCRGLYELVSLDQRKWSFIRQIHDVIMRPAYPGATDV